MHLAHPLGNDWGKRRVKNDERDANDLVDLLRLGRLAEAWDRATGVAGAAGAGPLPAQVDAPPLRVESPGAHGDGQTRCPASRGSTCSDRAAPRNSTRCNCRPGTTARLASLRRLIDVYSGEIAELDRTVASRLQRSAPAPGQLQALHGVGPVLAAVSWPRSVTSGSTRRTGCVRGRE